MNKHFVTFFSPGTFVDETTSKRTSEYGSVAEAVQMARDITERHGAKPAGFYFETKNEDGDVVHTSGMYFLSGRVRTLDEVEREDLPTEDILRENMRRNGHDVVVTNTNSWKMTKPFGEKDYVVNPQTGRVIRWGSDEDLLAYRRYRQRVRERKV